MHPEQLSKYRMCWKPPKTSWDIQMRRSYLSIWGVAMGCVHFVRLTDVPVCSETVASQAIHGMCLWVDGTNLAQVQISLDNNVKWSSHFLFLFINRLEITCDRRVYLWSDLDLAFIWIAEKMDDKWLQKLCTKPCSAKSRNNGNQYSLIFMCDIHRLLFD